MRPTPWLAQRWEWRADGLELVFLLRDGVHWHDGAPLTAADAAFTFEVYRTDTDSAVSELFALVDSLDAISERELRVGFTARDANWLFNVATLPILSRDQYGQFWQETAGDRADTVGVRLVELEAGWYRAVADFGMGRHAGHLHPVRPVLGERAVARPARSRGDQWSARQSGSLARR